MDALQNKGVRQHTLRTECQEERRPPGGAFGYAGGWLGRLLNALRVARRGLYGESHAGRPASPRAVHPQTAPAALETSGAAARDSLAGRARAGRVVVGTDLAYLRELVAYWADGFDWPAQRRRSHRFPTSASASMASGSTFVHVRAALRLGQSCRWSSATAGRTRSGATPRSSTSHRPRRTVPTPPTRSTWSCRHAGLRVLRPPHRFAPRLDRRRRTVGRAHGRPRLCALWRRGRGHRQPREPLTSRSTMRQVVAVHRTDAGCPSSPATRRPRARGARLARGRCGLGRDRGRLRCDAPHQAQTPPSLSPTRRPGSRVDRGEAPGVERLRDEVERRFTKDEILTNVTLYWLTGTIARRCACTARTPRSARAACRR